MKPYKTVIYSFLLGGLFCLIAQALFGFWNAALTGTAMEFFKGGAVLVSWDDGDDLLFLVEVKEVDGWHAFGVSSSIRNHVATHSVNLTEGMLPSDPNYSVSIYVRPGRLQILPKPITISTGSDSKPYDGTALTCDEVSVDGIVAFPVSTSKIHGI